MKKSEYILKNLVTRLNGLVDGRHIDELDEMEYTLYKDRCFAIDLIAKTYGYEIVRIDCAGKEVYVPIKNDIVRGENV